MSYTCLLMVLCECACANLISRANFNLIDRTDLIICLHIMFQISWTKKLLQVFGCSVRTFAQYISHIASIGRGNEKLCFLFQSDKNSGCYGNLYTEGL